MTAAAGPLLTRRRPPSRRAGRAPDSRREVEDYRVGTQDAGTAGVARSWMYWAMTAAAPRRTREAEEMLGKSVICYLDAIRCTMPAVH
jgi:hypothetical protein